jgi:alpha-glucosidase
VRKGGDTGARPWWRGAVFYQIYVRSFADSNDDGIGDLRGITSRLDYIKRLGVDAIWITPFYPSPQKDHGYDVADYFNVDPEYGTLADFDRLIKKAHRSGIKVLVDLVPNHTSDQHPWFQAALSSPDDPHRALYYFDDPKPDGSPPNNWKSVFGGSAWTKDERSGQLYLHLFAPEQPDLNWWNRKVPAEFERIVKFWLDRGADGYRIDVASALFKRKDLANQPMIKNPTTGKSEADPSFKIIDQPEVHKVYRAWRKILNRYEPDRVLVGEIFEPSRQARYILPDQLDMAFALVRARWDATLWRRSIDVDRRASPGPVAAPSWTQSNHDLVRHVTRLGGGPLGRNRARAALLLLLGLPGQAFLYQGEELGLEEVDVPKKMRQDPFFIHSGGKQRGRAMAADAGRLGSVRRRGPGGDGRFDACLLPARPGAAPAAVSYAADRDDLVQVASGSAAVRARAFDCRRQLSRPAGGPRGKGQAPHRQPAAGHGPGRTRASARELRRLARQPLPLRGEGGSARSAGAAGSGAFACR